MGDGLKLSKDKRHKSSSSLAGVVLEGTRSERKLDIRASIPEVDDQFTIAEARCDDLQEKIDLVKVLKRKRKLKKRSTTRMADPPAINENMPLITVRTQPKKILLITEVSQQAARLRRLEVPPNPARGYLDPATVEQHRMIGQVRGYNQMYRPLEQPRSRQNAELMHAAPRIRRRARADGDAMTSCDVGVCGQGVQFSSDGPLEVACGDDDLADFSDNDVFDHRNDYAAMPNKVVEARHVVKPPQGARRRHVPKETPPKETPKRSEAREEPQAQERWRVGSPPARRRPPAARPPQQTSPTSHGEERPVVELFNKALNRSSPPPQARNQTSPVDKKMKRTAVRETPRSEDQKTGPLRDSIPTEPKKESHRLPRRVKYRSRRYELPTVASQMKQAGVRYYYENANTANIPFVVSKSTAPSHNIGLNIQQVLNGVKIQQPLSGIPLTIAHHMGLGHVPTYGTRSAVMQPSLDNREINVIKLGRRMLRLPSYRYMSYSRLLSLYREGDGMVPRFLRAISRPHYFYTSMYNLQTHREDQDGATSKGRAGSQEAKQSLAEYASLYREYEQIEKCIKEGNYEPELERRKEELSKELAAREEHIRRVVQEYRSNEVDQSTLRASASTADETYRHSTFKLNLGDPPQ
ncbi:uncharacterized protein LOC114366186 isoform X2 [Ostrinia furnacalis]|uniref:uncharacterized protein LOC114366186 isoform X2 n=1 Tax=Ostrinia furnacalis TaxID=93504 RepID=UPI0010397E6C|nr:uncharacterized protein LOC114366186 isoform X2 [Ostrinia furnacalis]